MMASERVYWRQPGSGFVYPFQGGGVGQQRVHVLTDKELAARDERVREERTLPTVEHACELMHDAYEAAAVTTGWETQERSRKPWSEVPEANKVTMRAAVSAVLALMAASGGRP